MGETYFNVVWKRAQEGELFLASCVLNLKITALILGPSEPRSSYNCPSITQGCCVCCACLLLCNDLWQKFKRSCFWFLVQIQHLWLSLLVKKPMPLKVIQRTFFSVEMLQQYLGDFQDSHSEWVDCKINNKSLDLRDSFQFVSELRPMSYLSEIKYRSLS